MTDRRPEDRPAGTWSPRPDLPKVPPEQALILSTHSIYLDTQPLVESQFPAISTRLRELATLARNRGILVLVPAPVMQELERQFVERVEEANKNISQTAKLVRQLGASREIALLDVNTELARYRVRVNETMGELFMTRIAVTTASAAELFARAVARGRPFHATGSAKDAGFKDAVILRSICDDVEQRKSRTVLFVTADGDHAGIHDFHQATSAISRFTLAQALEALRATGATVEQMDDRKRRLELASDAISQELERLGPFIAEHAQLRYPVVPDTLETITGIVGATAVAARVGDMFPGLGDVAVGNDVEVALYAAVDLHVTVEHASMPDLPADATPQQRLFAELAARHESATATVPALAEVEGRLERTATGYQNIRPAAARLIGNKPADEEAVRMREERWTGRVPLK